MRSKHEKKKRWRARERERERKRENKTKKYTIFFWIYIICVCAHFSVGYSGLTLPKAHSAEAAISQARGSGDLAAWSKEKVILQGIGGLGKSSQWNRSRDLPRHLHKRGFMLNIPISWLKNVFQRVEYSFLLSSQLFLV